MNNIHYEIPTNLVSGDYYEVLMQFDDYPTTGGYSPYLYIRGVSSLNIIGTVSGDYYRFELKSENTQVLKAGTYQYSVSLKLNEQRVTVSTGYITVKENIAAISSKVTHAEKMLTAIEAVLEGRVTDDVISLSIAGRSITKIPLDELMILRANYMKELHILKNGTSATRKTVPIIFGKIT